MNQPNEAIPTNLNQAAISNDVDYLLCYKIDKRSLALCAAFLGCSISVLLAVTLIIILPWFVFPTTVDILILAGILTFTACGIGAAIFTCIAVKKNKRVKNKHL